MKVNGDTPIFDLITTAFIVKEQLIFVKLVVRLALKLIGFVLNCLFVAGDVPCMLRLIVIAFVNNLFVELIEHKLVAQEDTLK